MKKIFCFLLMIAMVVVTSVASAGIMVIPYVEDAVIGKEERTELEVLGHWKTLAVVKTADEIEDVSVYGPDGYLGDFTLLPPAFMWVEGVNLDLMNMLYISNEEVNEMITTVVLRRLLAKANEPSEAIELLLLPYHSDEILPYVAFVEEELDLALQGYGNEENADGKWVLALPDDGTPVTIAQEVLTRALGDEVGLTFTYVSWDEVLANMEYATPEAEATIRDWLTEQGIELEPTA